MEAEEFSEISACGGQYIVRAKTDGEGSRRVDLCFRLSRPLAGAIFAIYALPQGIPVGTVDLMGGGGDQASQPPYPGVLEVYVPSDSRGLFGRQCPRCRGYWRSASAPSLWLTTCAYCGIRHQCHAFVTDGQRAFVEACCKEVEHAIYSDEDGEFIVDMDAAAEAVARRLERPAFYFAEEKQQNDYSCDACGDRNDILGSYGYCSCCGTRNGQQVLRGELAAVRERANGGGPYQGCVRDAVSAFDALARSYTRQLVDRVALTPRRKGKLDDLKFHNLKSCIELLRDVFDIDLARGMKEGEVEFAIRMFHRRHVYEHNGGEADEKYIRDSGDTSVRPKQALREDRESVHRTVECVTRMAANLHDGFHQLFPPEQKPIRSKAKYGAQK